jgi:hypothetical protein
VISARIARDRAGRCPARASARALLAEPADAPESAQGDTMRYAIGLAALAAALGAYGCGGSTDGGPSGGAGSSATDGGDDGAAGPTPDQACGDVVKARCQRRDACTGGFESELRYGSESACEAREKIACLAGLAAPGTSGTSGSVETCAAAIPGESCDDFLANNPPSACTPAPGSVANGGACAFPAECQSTYCAIAKGATCGTCQPEPKAGDSCATTGECGRDLACSRATQICATYVATGGPCDKDHPCAPALSCVGASAKGSGTCQAAGATANAKCDPKEQTAPACDRAMGFYCQPSTGTCQTIELAGDGEACGVVNGAEVGCKAGGQCVIVGAAKSGTCKAPAADGAACDTQSGPPCMPPAQCVVTSDGGTSGTCTVPDATACK